MKSQSVYRSADREWFVLGRDPAKPDGIIDTNQYMVTSGGEAILLDPGGIELFAPVLSAVLRHTSLDSIKYLFASHQDPDIISSLGLWDKALQSAELHAPWLWEGFIRHFGMESIEYRAIPDEGSTVTVGHAALTFFPAHYLHASGNFHVYDPKAKILMSGDVGACLEPPGAPMYVDDFASHVPKMKAFHERWMPSNRAKKNWVARVRELDVEQMMPQHGRIFRGPAVGEFLDWFDNLEVGVAV